MGRPRNWKPRSCWSRWAASRLKTTLASIPPKWGWVGGGHKPITDNIGLDTTKVELDRGFIKVNEWQQTAEPGVYAIGDVVAGTPQLAHVATREGMVAVAHIAGKPVAPLNRNRIPSATYTEPGIGSVGMTEAQARAEGRKVK